MHIYTISLHDALPIFQSAKDHKEVIFNTIDDVIEKLENHINSTNYILQKTINISINQRVIDFRIRFEKNIENRWVLSLFARSEEHTSELQSRGHLVCR